MALSDKPIACYRTKDVAQRFGVKQRTVHAWIRAGHLLATRYPGTRDYRIAEEDIRSFEMLGDVLEHGGRKKGRKRTPSPEPEVTMATKQSRKEIVKICGKAKTKRKMK